LTKIISRIILVWQTR